MNPWIVNASPLILLGKINRLHLLNDLAPGFRIPESVASEILAGPDSDPSKIWIQSAIPNIIPDSSDSLEILPWGLGAGETAVISLALVNGKPICVLDDLAARKCAAVYGIPVIGTLGVLLKAKSSGALDKLRPEIDSLLAAGSMLSPQVIQEALHLAGESQ